MDPVYKEVCEQTQKVVDERFRRDKEDIREHGARIDKIEDLTIQMGEILKNHESRIGSHEKRIDKLESVSGGRWHKVVDYLIGGVVAALVAAAMSLLIR